VSQLLDVLFDDLRSCKNKVNRLLGAGILFALIAHFYVIEPYFEYKEQEPKLKKSLEEKKFQFDQLTGQSERMINLGQNIRTSQANIENKIKSFPQHLREILSDLWNVFHSDSSSNTSGQSTHAQRSAPVQQSIDTQQLFANMPPNVQQSVSVKIGEFFLPSDITTFNDGVHWYIETWFHEVLSDIRKEIEEPIMQAKITSDMVGDIDLQKITQQGIMDIQRYIDRVEKENPNFWKSYSGPMGKVDVAQELRHEVKKSFGLLTEKTDVLVGRLKEAVRAQKEELDKMNNDMTKLQEGKDKLDSRLSSLESPFGRIPAELPDLIKVFPILMAGLLVSVTTTLQKNNSLYISFREEFRKNNSEIDYKNFQRQADCWFLPPYTSIFQPFVLGFCIAIIAGVFVRASLLVVSEPSLFTSLTGEPVTIRKNLFLCAYIMSGIVIIGCLWLIGKISMKRV
jgi:predicted nuclease with TOPRIM domain